MTTVRILIAAATTAVLCNVAGCASAAGDKSAHQTVYLDPETGDVIQHPAEQGPSAQSKQQIGQNAGQTSKKSGYTRWQTEDGTRMLSVDPNKAPKERVVRCDDGSLRMGGSAEHASQDSKASADPCQKTLR
ncbi:hypothetical protein V5738_06455 [Salinisphaera sp. SPP-AMP-43]|uniref:hypothetical protein n=1 Tax=Salinisphaera sp. SPP-AMP-43 TaxID=3121288 RepID=UPI003C6DE736